MVMWKIGAVQRVHVSDVDDAWGFNVATEESKPLVSFAYATEAAAKSAAAHVADAVASAVMVHAHYRSG
jgi:hypothetical protein